MTIRPNLHLDRTKKLIGQPAPAIAAFLLALTLAGPKSALAGGAYINEVNGASEVGYAGVGSAGRAGDASTVFTNPAGMTRFDKSEFIAGATPIYLYVNFNPNEKTTIDGSAGQTSELVPFGSAAYIRPVSDRLKLGVSVGNYFGLALDWSGQWVGRYNTVKTQLIAPQVQPTVAYRVSDWLSVGAGAALTLGYLYDKLRIEPLNPDAADGKATFSDADFAVQGNFGIMIEPTEKTRIGIRYLTETDLDFEDGVEFSGIGPDFDPTPNADFVTPANAIDMGTKMPQQVMVGAHHQLNNRWGLLGSVGWDEWSEFGRINIAFDGTNLGTQVDAGFRDVWHFGVGAEHRYSDKWTFTGGVSYDTSMMTDATRPVNVPLGTMYRYGLGFQYRKRKGLTLGGGVSLMYEGNLPIKDTPAGQDGLLSGKYDDNISLWFFNFHARWH